MTYEELLKENEKLNNENRNLSIDLKNANKELENKNIELKSTNIELQNTNMELQNTNMELQNTNIKLQNAMLELNALKRMLFGKRREKLPETEELVEGKQFSIFEKEEDIQKHVEEQSKEQVEEITTTVSKKRKEKKAGIKKDKIKDILVKKVEILLNENEKCPECNGELKEVDKVLDHEELVFNPATFTLVQYFRAVYKCKECGTKESKKDTPTFVKTKAPAPLLTHSFVSPSLATEVIYQKYYLGVPLYRQEKMWDDKGLVLPRNMMANWNIKISEYYLEDVYELMQIEMKLNNKLIHCDETVMQCNKEAGRSASSNSYMWVMRSGEEEKIKGVIFKYSPSRSEEVAKDFLKGYKEILVTDGYASYKNIEVRKHAECWAHARRYFYESIPLINNKEPDVSSDGYIGVKYCDKLFEIEEKIAEFSVEEKQSQREEHSKPILDAFYEWVNDTLTNKVVVNKKLFKALNYANNQRKELSEFIEDGRIPLTNSLAERAIRPFAVHRKNWLFADSVAGAKANAVMYSLIESAKVNNLNIYKYIEYLLEELPQLEVPIKIDTLRRYLPWSKELPDEVRNFEGKYEELKVE